MNTIRISVIRTNQSGQVVSIRAEGGVVKVIHDVEFTKQNVFTFLRSSTNCMLLRAWIWSYEECIKNSGFVPKTGRNTVRLW